MKLGLTAILLTFFLTGCLSGTPLAELSWPPSSSVAQQSFPTSSMITQNSLPEAQVISVGDGDTLRVQKGNDESITVRLSCVDAPESSQRGGQASTNRLKELLPRGSDVQLRTIERDQYGRTVAEVFRNGRSINLQLVEEGEAVVYDEYLDACANTRKQYLEAEAQAKAQQLGFWSQPNPILPSDYRQGERPSTSESSNAEASDSASCTNGDCDCSNFDTQAQAQQVLEADSAAPYQSDSDRFGGGV